MQSKLPNVRLFTGTSHPSLALELANQLGIKLSGLKLERFPDGEIDLEIKESVRGTDVVLLQTVALDPNEYLMELLIMIDAARRASARSIMVVIPYFGYCRQDRKDKPRVPITAKLVANMLTAAGATRVLTIDLHAGQLQGFFDIPVDNLYGRPRLVEAFKGLVSTENCVVVTPDIGSVKLARSYAAQLGVPMAIIDKQRFSADVVTNATLIGDVEGKNVLLADDICSTGGTLLLAAKATQEKGAKRIFAAVTHGIFAHDTLQKIEQSPIEALLVSNTIPITGLEKSSKIRTVSIAPLLAEGISRVLSQESISSLYEIV